MSVAPRDFIAWRDAVRDVWREALGAALLTLLTCIVGLTAKSIWLDEAVSIEFANTGFRDLVPVLTRDDPNMGLYYLLLNAWRRAFGDGPAAMRAPSVLATALNAGAIVVLGRMLFTRGAGVLAGLMFACHALAIWYAQTARAYAFVALLSVLCTIAFVSALHRPTRGALAAWVCCAAALVYFHYLGALVPVAHGVYVLMFRPALLRSRAHLAAACALAVLLAPAALAARRGGTARIDWIAPPTLQSVVEVFSMLGGRSLTLCMLLLALGAVSAARATRARRQVPAARGDGHAIDGAPVSRAHALVGCWLLVPLSITLAVSFARPLFLPLYVIATLPALLLWGASAMSQFRHRLAAASLGAVLLASLIPGARWWHREGFHEDWQAAAATLAAGRQMGAAPSVITIPFYGDHPLNYALRRIGLPEILRGASRRAALEAPRVWLIIRDEDTPRVTAEVDDLRRTLGSTRKLVLRYEPSRLTMELYERQR